MSNGAAIRLETATTEEIVRFFPRSEDLTFDRASLEQWETLKRLANEHDLSVGEMIVIIRMSINEYYNPKPFDINDGVNFPSHKIVFF